jgi:hypothetical protein
MRKGSFHKLSTISNENGKIRGYEIRMILKTDQLNKEY